MKYIPHSQQEIEKNKKKLNINEINDLFSHIPSENFVQTSQFLEKPKTEEEIRRYFRENIEKDYFSLPPYKNFMGGNGHAHEIPAIINPIVSRGEYLTAYTPYQPEVSQGTLQAMFEYQSIMAELMKVDVSNSSLYDGSTATVEAILMSCRVQKKYKVLVSSAFFKEYLETIKTYSKYGPFEYEILRTNSRGQLDLDYLKNKITDDISAIVVQSPNTFGVIENLAEISKIAKEKNVLLIVSILEALSLAFLEPPGIYADIVCGEAQSFGIPLNFGGPWLGFLGTKKDFIRNMPGRLVGIGKDKNENTAFVITLSTREQHIRREKATSNICTNQGLMALRASIYLSLMGKSGLSSISLRCAKLTQYAKNLIKSQYDIKLKYPDSPVFNELLIQTPVPAEKVFDRVFESRGITIGTIIDENLILSSFNETMNKSDIELWQKLISIACK